jgi:hypothetical protein
VIYSEQVTEFSQEYFGMIVRDINAGVSDPGSISAEPVYKYDHQFEYNLKLGQAFIPRPGARYWISIVSGPIDNAGTLWGWTTSPIPDPLPASGPVNSCSNEVLPEKPYQMAFVLSGKQIVTAPESTRYKLVEGSTLVVDWVYTGIGTPDDAALPEEAAPPTIITPITGDFFLTSVIPETDDLTRHYSVSGLDFRAKHFSEQYWGHRGTGNYFLDDQQAIPLSDAKAILDGDAPVVLPIFSPRSAEILATETQGTLAPLVVIAISRNTLEAWTGRSLAHAEAVSSPTAHSLLQAIATFCVRP